MEEWRPIKGFEGKYSVSSLGNVRSHGRMVLAGSGFRRIPDKILVPEKHYKGYHRVMFVRDHYFVHRLVADAFLAEAHTTDVVNHKNGNKTDNRVENLEWATFQENTIHYHQVLKPQYTPPIEADDEIDPSDLPW